MKKVKSDVTAVFLIIILVVGSGWVMNLYKLANCDFESPYKAEVIHTVGLIPIVGMFTGWMDFGE